MTLDIDFLIDFFKKHTTNEPKEEMEEQDDGGSSTSGGGSIPKWADSYPLTRGKANRLGASGEKWETGLTRGAANQIW
jgi:hypothetical protein